jgi:ketosteroid isomerase-like protein
VEVQILSPALGRPKLSLAFSAMRAICLSSTTPVRRRGGPDDRPQALRRTGGAITPLVAGALGFATSGHPLSPRGCFTSPIETDPDIALVTRAYDALNRGDVAGALAPLSENAEWHESAALPESDVYRGRETIREFLEGFLESWDEFVQEVEDVVRTGDKLVVLLSMRGRGRESGVDVDASYAHVWTLRDGRAIRVDAFYDRERALEAASP